MTKRKIEVFSAGCPLCQDAIDKVNYLACPSCEVNVVDMNDANGARRAAELGVKSVPAVAVNDKLADCCIKGGIDQAVLHGAGLGQPIANN